MAAPKGGHAREEHDAAANSSREMQRGTGERAERYWHCASSQAGWLTRLGCWVMFITWEPMWDQLEFVVEQGVERRGHEVRSEGRLKFRSGMGPALVLHWSRTSTLLVLDWYYMVLYGYDDGTVLVLH